jgi:hypothetical protein
MIYQRQSVANLKRWRLVKLMTLINIQKINIPLIVWQYRTTALNYEIIKPTTKRDKIK